MKVKILLIFLFFISIHIQSFSQNSVMTVRELFLKHRIENLKKQLKIYFTTEDSIAAEKGNNECQFNVGLALCNKGNYIKGKYFLECAMKKNDIAKCIVAEMEYYGIASDINKQRAFDLLSEAKKNGEIVANCLLGIIYYNGDIIKKNYKKAVLLFTSIPDTCIYSRTANFYLYKCYKYGRGVNQDIKEANNQLNKLKQEMHINERNGFPIEEQIDKLISILYSEYITPKEICETNLSIFQYELNKIKKMQKQNKSPEIPKFAKI